MSPTTRQSYRVELSTSGLISREDIEGRGAVVGGEVVVKAVISA
jgi:hypothetical protein